MEKEVLDLKRMIYILVELYEKLILSKADQLDQDLMVMQLHKESLLALANMINPKTILALEKVGFDYQKAIGEPLNRLYGRMFEDLYR